MGGARPSEVGLPEKDLGHRNEYLYSLISWHGLIPTNFVIYLRGVTSFLSNIDQNERQFKGTTTTQTVAEMTTLSRTASFQFFKGNLVFPSMNFTNHAIEMEFGLSLSLTKLVESVKSALAENWNNEENIQMGSI